MDEIQEIKNLIIARLQTRPSDIAVSIGGMGSYTSSELIDHVEAGDDVGKKIVEAEMKFLRSLKTGDLYKLLEQDEAATNPA